MRFGALLLFVGAVAANAQEFEGIMSERVASGMQYLDGIVWSRETSGYWWLNPG